MLVQPQDKLLSLVSFILQHRSSKIIVYYLTCAYVDYVSRALPVLMEAALQQQQQQQQQQPQSSKKKLKCAAATSHVSPIMPLPPMLSLHGKMVQKRREKTYEAFVNAPTAVRLCTDVAGEVWLC